MKMNYWILMICLLAGSLVGCSDDEDDYDMEKIFVEEQISIAKYLATKAKGEIIGIPITFNSGRVDSVYVFNLDNEAGAVEGEKGDWVLGTYNTYGINRMNQSENLLDSTDPKVFIGAGVTPYFSLGGPIYLGVDDGSILGVLLSYVNEKGSGEILVPSRIAGQDGVSKLFKLEANKIIKDKLIGYENTLIKNFLDTAKYVTVRDVPSSAGELDTIAKVAVIKEFQEELQIEVTDSVKLYYEGYILDEFNTPLRKFIDMKEDKAVFENYADLKTKGLKMTIAGLRKGEEAYVLLPSGMGYGDEGGFISVYQCSVPPYSTLVYKIKVVDVRKNAPK